MLCAVRFWSTNVTWSYPTYSTILSSRLENPLHSTLSLEMMIALHFGSKCATAYRWQRTNAIRDQLLTFERYTEIRQNVSCLFTQRIFQTTCCWMEESMHEIRLYFQEISWHLSYIKAKFQVHISHCFEKCESNIVVPKNIRLLIQYLTSDNHCQLWKIQSNAI